jgi:peptidyl-prolyl cis-trans isomerase C
MSNRLVLRMAVIAFTGVAVSAATATAAGKDRTADPAVTGKEVVMVVNGKPVDLMSLMMAVERSGMRSGEGVELARDEIADNILLSQEATKLGLAKHPEVSRALELDRISVLANAYVMEQLKRNPITPAAIKEQYEKRRDAKQIKEYHVRQILVHTKAHAEALIGALNKGTDFADLARNASMDIGADRTAGDLGWFNPDIFVDAAFNKAVENLKKGEYTRNPVKTRFGWNIIKLEDGPRPVANPPSFASLPPAAQDAMQQRAQGVAYDALVAKLRKTAKIEQRALPKMPEALPTKSVPVPVPIAKSETVKN